MKEKPTYYVDYESYDDRHYAEKELDPLGLLELLKRFDKSVDHKTGDIKNKQDYWNCLTAIRNYLAVPTIETINKILSNFLERIERDEARLRNHRHNYSETYTGKAEY